MGYMKTCTACDQAKPLDQFYPKRAQCRACFNAKKLKLRCACGTPMRVGAAQCKACHVREAGLLGAAAARKRRNPELAALRRAKAGTRRWLRNEAGKRCPVCLKRVRSKNGATYCSYTCFRTAYDQPRADQRFKSSVNERTRARVLRRDGFVCQICQEPTSLVHDPADDLSPEIDHIIPVREGGRATMANLRVAHRKCNRDRNEEWYDSVYNRSPGVVR